VAGEKLVEKHEVSLPRFEGVLCFGMAIWKNCKMLFPSSPFGVGFTPKRDRVVSSGVFA
jgi:hypothetical protein